MQLKRLLALIALLVMLISTAPARAAEITNASDLRVALNVLLREHTFLAAAATNAALDGREAEFDAAAAALDANSVDISKAIGAVYGADAEAAFLPLWREHIGFFVDYTQGVAAKDQAKQDQAVADLTAYAEDFGAFLSSANPNLPKDAVADLVTEHVLTLKAVVDAQASGDDEAAYAELRTAAAHMDMIAAPLAGAIVQQFPDTFAGDADSADVQLRNTLNAAFQEHTFLAAAATNAALDGREAEFNAAAAALDANSVDISKAIGSVYGADAEAAFLPLWREHIGFFVDYTQGVAAKDQAKQDQAVADLTAYTEDFGAFLSSANPNLPKDAVADLVTEHVLTLKTVVDAQASGDQDNAYAELRAAMAHMQMIGDPLASAIVQQFPERFTAEGAAPATPEPGGMGMDHSGGTMGGSATPPATMPTTSAAPAAPLGLLIGLALALAAVGTVVLVRSRRAA